MGVQARGGRLPDGQEHAHLVLLGHQALGEVRHARRHEGGARLAGQRQPDVGGGDGLGGELADGPAELESEGRP